MHSNLHQPTRKLNISSSLTSTPFLITLLIVALITATLIGNHYHLIMEI